MKILFCGDVVGRAGREAIFTYLPYLKEKLNWDFLVVNGENAAHGFGLTPKMFSLFRQKGVDVITMGNHTFDKKDIFTTLENEERLIRPLNYPKETIGHGFGIFELSDGRKIAIVQLLGQLFMRPTEDPFTCINSFLEKYVLGKDVQAILVDMHGEATSEKMSMGFFCDGRVSLVAGTHTHIPTADAMILPKGTGYITDVGMCGDYYSVIGMKVETALPRFTHNTRQRLQPAEEKGTLCAVFLETNDNTGLCTNIRSVRIGAHLAETD